jgi:ABC-type multidrug transport system ATPase subunit
MEIILNQIGRRYNFNWIFKNINQEIVLSDKLVILGANGSGKSTLMQILSGAISPSEGSIKWSVNKQEIIPEKVYQHLSFASPYLELIEDFTLKEHLNFHFSLKKSMHQLTINEMISLSGLQHAADKRIGYFSSGMKQRVKLLLAILSDTSFLLLDEPLSNLDKQASNWYTDLINRFSENRTIIVSSNNIEQEYQFCNKSIQL